METICPCGSNHPFAQCCEPYITGAAIASTPEALMRSRYSAYATRNFDYIESTMKGAPLKSFNRVDTEKSAQQVTWDKLEVISVSEVKPEDEEGFVEFKAYYTAGNKTDVIYEKSRFIKKKGKWFYIEGIEKEKIGRNDPCSCGSGKKYKKCCEK
jgi:SEC-C motif-containing protein